MLTDAACAASEAARELLGRGRGLQRDQDSGAAEAKEALECVVAVFLGIPERGGAGRQLTTSTSRPPAFVAALRQLLTDLRQ